MNSNEKQKEYWTNSAGNLWVKDKSEKYMQCQMVGLKLKFMEQEN